MFSIQDRLKPDFDRNKLIEQRKNFENSSVENHSKPPIENHIKTVFESPSPKKSVQDRLKIKLNLEDKKLIESVQNQFKNVPNQFDKKLELERLESEQNKVDEYRKKLEIGSLKIEGKVGDKNYKNSLQKRLKIQPNLEVENGKKLELDRSKIELNEADDNPKNSIQNRLNIPPNLKVENRKKLELDRLEIEPNQANKNFKKSTDVLKIKSSHEINFQEIENKRSIVKHSNIEKLSKSFSDYKPISNDLLRQNTNEMKENPNENIRHLEFNYLNIVDNLSENFEESCLKLKCNKEYGQIHNDFPLKTALELADESSKDKNLISGSYFEKKRESSASSLSAGSDVELAEDFDAENDCSKQMNSEDMEIEIKVTPEIQKESKTAEDDQKTDDFTLFSDKIMKMMLIMGHKKGEGLGQKKQGIVEPIELKGNLGLRGLGHEVKGLEAAKLTWDSEKEDIQVKEFISWLKLDENKNCKYIEEPNLIDWMKIKTKKLTIEDETQYCKPELLEKVLKAKEVFDELDLMELCRARSRANPFETLRSAFFMNRAALKMANIDAITDFMFTGVDRQVDHKQNKTPYYFADICAGPGGFSEYILWRKKWAFKGYGLTLRGEHDFKLHESTCAPFETFEALYGIYGDGDIYRLENIQDFCNRIKSQTQGEGVHFIMGDGGFSVEGQENIQEILSKRLYVCQCYTALNSLRPNGHFLTKLFDLFTPFSVGLMFLMYHCFEKISIIKPNTSRPANSERYLVCSKLKNHKITQKIRKYLRIVVQKLWDMNHDLEQNNLDIYELVPSEIIKKDEHFFRYITESNNRLAEKQIIGLEKLATFCRDPTLFEPRQEELRVECLKFWQIPDKNRSPLPHVTHREVLPSSILNNNFETQIFSSFEPLVEIIKKPKNWHYMFLGNNKKFNHCEVYVGVKNNVVYRSYYNNKWVKVKNVRLVKGTIIFAELLKEYKNPESLKYKKYLHVVDALKLGDLPLGDFSFNERRDLINVYCQALNCPSRMDLVGLRMKKTYCLSEMHNPTVRQTENGECYFSTIDQNSKKYTHFTNSILFLQTDSSQNFHSIISNRYVVRLNEIQNEINPTNTNVQSNIVNLLEKINFRTNNT